MSDAETIRALLNDDWTLDDCAVRFGLSIQDLLRRLHPTTRKTPLYTRGVSLKLDPATHEEVLARARREGRNQADILRELIEWGLQACEP